jgi:hypothetical protein
MSSDYEKYRGKCKEMSEALVTEDSTLRLVRGHYWCPIWNTEEPHWWCVKEDGTIVDPTAKQFGSKGCGEYTEFDGNITCEECGKQVLEEDAQFMGQHPVCSYSCGARLVGIGV